jgi:hypothetical protein
MAGHVTDNAQNMAMAVNTLTLASGALVTVLGVAEIYFDPVKGRTRAEKPRGMIRELALVAALIGWLIMWITE